MFKRVFPSQRRVADCEKPGEELVELLGAKAPRMQITRTARAT